MSSCHDTTVTRGVVEGRDVFLSGADGEGGEEIGNVHSSIHAAEGVEGTIDFVCLGSEHEFSRA